MSSEYGNSQALVNACIQGNLVTFSSYLNNPDICIHDSNWQNSLLQLACQHNQPDIVALLLNLPYISQYTSTRYNSESPAKIAAAIGSIQIVALLINSGYFSINDFYLLSHGSENRLTLLQISALNKHYDLVKWMLKKYESALTLHPQTWRHAATIKARRYFKGQPRLDIKGRYTKGITAFEAACSGGNLDIVKLLLPYFRDDILTLSNGLEYACINGHKDVVEMLLDLPGIEVTCEAAAGLVDKAFKGLHFDLLDLLLQLKNKQGEFVFTQEKIKEIINSDLLHEQCSNSFWSDNNKMEWLLKRPELDVNKKNVMGESPLHIACSSGKADRIEALLKRRDIDIYSVDRNGDVPLQTALKYYRLRKSSNGKILEVFLEHASLHAQSANLFKQITIADYHDLLEYFSLLVPESFNSPPALNLLLSDPRFIQSNLSADGLDNLLQCEPFLDDKSKKNLTIMCIKYLFNTWDKNQEIAPDTPAHIVSFIQKNTSTMQPAIVYVTGVTLSDNFWKLVSAEGNEDMSNIIRFWQIMQKLPLDLQMVLALRLFDKMGINIPGINFEAALRCALPPAPLPVLPLTP
jgi:ankyrin repeat protein